MINLATVLKLTRPIAVLDLEATGVNPDQDRIVQIAVTIHYPAKDPVPWQSLVNPGVPIPADASAVHHITDEQVAAAHSFKVMAVKLARVLTDVDFAGHNVTFDLRLLRAEMRRASVEWDWEGKAHVVDTLRIFQILFPRDLDAAYKEFVDNDGFQGAHDAGHDVAATEAVLVGQLARFTEVPRDVPELAEWCFPRDPSWVDRSGKIAWRGGVACINFGKRHNGRPLKDVDRGYLDWMLANDFPEDTKRILREALLGVYPTR